MRRRANSASVKRWNNPWRRAWTPMALWYGRYSFLGGSRPHQTMRANWLSRINAIRFWCCDLKSEWQKHNDYPTLGTNRNNHLAYHRKRGRAMGRPLAWAALGMIIQFLVVGNNESASAEIPFRTYSRFMMGSEDIKIFDFPPEEYCPQSTLALSYSSRIRGKSTVL
jgi:hypothetical protein